MWIFAKGTPFGISSIFAPPTSSFKGVTLLTIWGSYIPWLLEFMYRCFSSKLCYITHTTSTVWIRKIGPANTFIERLRLILQYPISIARTLKYSKRGICGSCNLHVICIVDTFITKEVLFFKVKISPFFYTSSHKPQISYMDLLGWLKIVEIFMADTL